MISEHYSFKPPTDENQMIWRFMDFTKFVDLISSKKLYFARSDHFPDIFEGSLTKMSIEKRKLLFLDLKKRGIFPNDFTEKMWTEENKQHIKGVGLNCWHMNNFESEAMWKLFLNGKEGVAIQSTYKRLVKSLDSCVIDVNVGIINYIDYDKEEIDILNLIEPFAYKRMSYEHESELRCLTMDMHLGVKDPRNMECHGVKAEINLKDLIENIYVSPGSSSWFTELVQEISYVFNLDNKIINSCLDDKPLF